MNNKAIQRAMETIKNDPQFIADTGIDPDTFLRVAEGLKNIKMPDLILIAQQSGASIRDLTGIDRLSDRVRVQPAAGGNEKLREKVMDMLRLSDYLDDQGIPQNPNCDVKDSSVKS